ncbi:hypothetical protein HU200_003489 [Digitaria exilis]|uniref:Cyclin-like domain-containing protein n=1 Tax=Digitaria exilis TaxID=1010633 RepID=A0A835FVI3_9POAL|nr:hypothetical protein HU200_003489 [Digitaria exilis]CAB3462475.1 unnamed protein product [Digitaria exilis]
MVLGDEMMPVEAAAAAAEDWSACAFSLTCDEDCADLGDGSVVDEGESFSPYNAGDEEEEEYLEHLVFKETSFCSSSSDSAAADCDGDEDAVGEYHSALSEEWFRRARLDAVKWILETRGCFGFSHRTAYLAIAYFDSFLLRRRVDREAMPWAARLLSVACVSVAAKMEECQVPALSELDAGGDYDFCPASICRMELLVLSTLGWRMDAVTPLDFLPCFSSRLHPHGGAGAGGGRVALKAIGFIFATAEAGSVLDHRPSTVAAAAILAATYGPLLTKEALDSKMSYLSPSCLIIKEHVHACYSTMVRDMNRRGNKRSLPCSGCNEVATSIDSVLVDDVTDTFATAVAARNKRIRLELPGIR